MKGERKERERDTSRFSRFSCDRKLRGVNLCALNPIQRNVPLLCAKYSLTISNLFRLILILVSVVRLGVDDSAKKKGMSLESKR